MCQLHTPPTGTLEVHFSQILYPLQLSLEKFKNPDEALDQTSANVVMYSH